MLVDQGSLRSLVPPLPLISSLVMHANGKATPSTSSSRPFDFGTLPCEDQFWMCHHTDTSEDDEDPRAPNSQVQVYHASWAVAASAVCNARFRDVRRFVQFGVGLPAFSISPSLVHVTFCQCPLSGLSVYSLCLLSLNLPARISACEVLASLVHCAQTPRNALVPASKHFGRFRYRGTPLL